MQRYVTSVEVVEVDFARSFGDKIDFDAFPAPPKFPLPNQPLHIWSLQDPDADLARCSKQLREHLRAYETSVSENFASIQEEYPEFVEHFAKVTWFISWYLWCWGDKTICRFERQEEVYLSLINWLLRCPVFLKATSTPSPLLLRHLLKFANILVKMAEALGLYCSNWYQWCWVSSVVFPKLLRKTLEWLTVKDTELATDRDLLIGFLLESEMKPLPLRSQHIVVKLRDVAFKPTPIPLDCLLFNLHREEPLINSIIPRMLRKVTVAKSKLSQEADLDFYSAHRSISSIEKYIDTEMTLKRLTRRPTDMMLFALKEGGWPYKEIRKLINQMEGAKLTDASLRQRLSRLREKIRD